MDSVLAEIAAAVRNDRTHLSYSPENHSTCNQSNCRSCLEASGGSQATNSCIKLLSHSQRTSNTASGRLITFQSHSSPVGKLMLQRTSKFIVSPKAGKRTTAEVWERKYSWVLMPSLFSRCMQFQYTNSYETINWSFRTYPVIPTNHPVWDMCTKGDITGFQSLFSEGRVSPFSVSRQGRSLLHVSHFPQRQVLTRSNFVQCSAYIFNLKWSNSSLTLG